MAAGFIQTREVFRSLGEGQRALQTSCSTSASPGPRSSFGHMSPEHFYGMHQQAPRHGPPSSPPSPPVLHISLAPTAPVPPLNQSPLGHKSGEKPRCCHSPSLQDPAEPPPAMQGRGGGKHGPWQGEAVGTHTPVGRFCCTSITMFPRAGTCRELGPPRSQTPSPLPPSCWEADRAVPAPQPS